MKIKSFDVLWLFLLVIARVRSDTLADRLVARRRMELIQRIPVVGSFHFPFWIPDLLVCVPLFVFLLWRQWTRNSISSMFNHYAFVALAFFTDEWDPAHRTTPPPQ